MHLENGSLIAPQAFIEYLNGSLHNDPPRPNLGWNFPSQLQHMVHVHWRGFPSPQIYYTYAFFIAYFVLMIMSIFGNGLVIWIFSTSKNLRTPSNLLIINLAIFDLVMCTNIPHNLLNAIAGYFVGGELGCDIYAVNGGISGFGGSISNAFIAYDRYKTISNPIDGRLNMGQIGLLIALSWLWAIPFSVLPFFRIWGHYIPEGYLTTCSFDYLTDTDETRLFVHCIFIWAYCIPTTIIWFNYARLFFHVRAHERMLAEQAKKMNVKSLSANANTEGLSVEMRIAKAALTIYLLFVLAWTPYSTVALLSSFGYREMVTPFVSMLPATAAKTVSCLDPWVYAASHPKYRLELERRVPWLGIREKSGGGKVGDGGAGGAVGSRERSSTADGESTNISMDTMA